MDISPVVLRQRLEDKFGFNDASGSGRGKHFKYKLYVDGQWVAQTQVPRSRDPVRQTLAGLIAKQLGVTQAQLREMVACTMTREAYLAIVLSDTD